MTPVLRDWCHESVVAVPAARVARYRSLSGHPGGDGVVPASFFTVLDPLYSGLRPDGLPDLPFSTTAHEHITVLGEVPEDVRLGLVLTVDAVDERVRRDGSRLVLVRYLRRYLAEGADVVRATTTHALLETPAAVSPPAPDEDDAGLLLDAAGLAEWSDVSGDHEPLHTDEAAAAAMGLPAPVAHASLATALGEAAAARQTGRSQTSVTTEHRQGVFRGQRVTTEVLVESTGGCRVEVRTGAGTAAVVTTTVGPA